MDPPYGGSVCVYVWSITFSRLGINRVWLPILLVVSWAGKTEIFPVSTVHILIALQGQVPLIPMNDWTHLHPLLRLSLERSTTRVTYWISYVARVTVWGFHFGSVDHVFVVPIFGGTVSVYHARSCVMMRTGVHIWLRKDVSSTGTFLRI